MDDVEFSFVDAGSTGGSNLDDSESEATEDEAESGKNCCEQSNPVSLEMRDVDLSEINDVEEFLQQGCGCTLLEGQQCCSAFTREHITSIRDQCTSFQRHELNNILLGHIMATVRTSEKTVKIRQPATIRSRNTTTFLHEGHKVVTLKVVSS